MAYSTYPILKDTMLLCEIIAMFTGLLYYGRIKNTHWKWFVYYLVFIVFTEVPLLLLYKYLNVNVYYKNFILNFVVIPTEFMFFFWLFGMKSLKIPRFYLFSVISFFVVFILEFLLTEDIRAMYVITYSVGIAFFIIYLILEFLQWLKSDRILYYYEDKMFYISIGIVLGYITNFPFHAFYNILVEDYISFWNFYYLVFLLSFTFMYLLFAASFIWGKTD